MKLQTKAYYNLLRQQKLADPSIATKPWQVEDLRDHSTHELLQKLQELGVDLSEEGFILYAENAKTPEQLASLLSPAPEQYDPIYLVIFELWRRLLSENVSLSIFCDELDTRIMQYEKESKHTFSAIENILIKLEELLEEGTDSGQDPVHVFQSLFPYCVHDIETFLYEFITDQIEAGNHLYAAELLDIFHPYVSDMAWFDFARAKIAALTDPHEANVILKSILDELEQESDLDLLLEMATFLVSHGDPHLFMQAARQAFEALHTEEDFQELVAIATNYCRCCEMGKEEKALKAIFARRTAKDLSAPLSKADQDVVWVDRLLCPSLLPGTEAT